ncbi:molybdate transport system permease protein [Methanomicrobium sp. W14]|uniref:ABC transporter permease n=1 Tax=Methanomicrobium sp. W14 TaxID=2817839 RepID=UPI001AE5FAA3|nr:ABC transporter permease [Methanomicrobium sp. W14]MBP2134152.1 molybdate transport system permease protein [Methanomicrobium sp. W14]
MDSTQFQSEKKASGIDKRKIKRQGVTFLVFALLTLFLIFILLPVASLFLKITPEGFIEALQQPAVLDALSLSLTTAGISTVIVILLGTPLSYINARTNYRGKNIVDTLTDLPIVLPPAVAGLALLMAFGRKGVLGVYLDAFGIQIAFTTLAVIFAQVFVASPFYIRQARASFEAVDIIYENAAKTLGASKFEVLTKVTIPIAWAGLVSGSILSFARALGEFGATIMFAGNYQGRTQTMPLAIYTTMQSSMDEAISLSIILVAISFAVILTVKYVTKRGV